MTDEKPNLSKSFAIGGKQPQLPFVEGNRNIVYVRELAKVQGFLKALPHVAKLNDFQAGEASHCLRIVVSVMDQLMPNIQESIKLDGK